jgi:DNA-binding MurR/RpiR family transcriptional regulator
VHVPLEPETDEAMCSIQSDCRRATTPPYFRQFRDVAEHVAARGIPLVLIADIECYWARELTPHALLIPTSEVWDSYCAMSSLFSLIVAAVASKATASWNA